MSITAHVYQIHIAADAATVWLAITQSEWTREYFHGTTYAEGPAPGARYRTVTADGGDAIDGIVEEMTPPAAGVPGRFVQTWHVLYDAAMAQEPPSRVEWTVEQVGDGLTRVRLVHGDLAAQPAHLGQRQGRLGVGPRRDEERDRDRPLPAPARRRARRTTRPRPPRATGTGGRGSRPTTRPSTCSTPTAGPTLTSGCSGWRTPRRTTGSGRAAPARRTPSAPTTSWRGRSPPPGQPGRGLVTAERALARCEPSTDLPTSTSPTRSRRRPGRCTGSAVPTTPPASGPRPARSRWPTPRTGRSSRPTSPGSGRPAR